MDNELLVERIIMLSAETDNGVRAFKSLPIKSLKYPLNYSLYLTIALVFCFKNGLFKKLVDINVSVQKVELYIWRNGSV